MWQVLDKHQMFYYAIHQCNSQAIVYNCGSCISVSMLPQPPFVQTVLLPQYVCSRIHTSVFEVLIPAVVKVTYMSFFCESLVR
jgi:hypothetical protein